MFGEVERLALAQVHDIVPSTAIDAKALSERCLIESLARDEAWAADAFVREFQPRIESTLRHLGIAPADVPDVSQEVLLDVFRQLRSGQFNGGARLFSWIYNIIRGKAVDHRRQSARRRVGATVSLEAAQLTNARQMMIAPDQDALLAADEALASLPVRLQAIMRLHHCDNVQIECIAAHFQLSEKRIRGLLTEGKVRLRRLIHGGEKNRRVQRLSNQTKVALRATKVA
jgi:RNA polymerase sigma factor (sigma-70 family)